MKKIIHVNQHTIKHNRKYPKDLKPPITVKTYKSNDQAFHVHVQGEVVFVYRPDKPLSCGAHLWAETTDPVYIQRNINSKGKWI